MTTPVEEFIDIPFVPGAIENVIGEVPPVAVNALEVLAKPNVVVIFDPFAI